MARFLGFCVGQIVYSKYFWGSPRDGSLRVSEPFLRSGREALCNDPEVFSWLARDGSPTWSPRYYYHRLGVCVLEWHPNRNILKIGFRGVLGVCLVGSVPSTKSDPNSLPPSSLSLSEGDEFHEFRRPSRPYVFSIRDLWHFGFPRFIRRSNFHICVTAFFLEKWKSLLYSRGLRACFLLPSLRAVDVF